MFRQKYNVVGQGYNLKNTSLIIMNWVSNLCNCFSPQLRKNIIGYLSSSNLNRQVVEEQKCTQKIHDNEDGQQSIYEHVKQRSYYTIHGDDIEHIQKQKFQEKGNQIQFENELDPCWYPEKGMSYDEIFTHKLKALKAIFESEIDEQYQKVYDSQDENCLLIYAKNQLDKGKRNNIYRFSFNVPNSDQPSQPKDFLQLETFTEDGKSLVESLLKHKQLIKKTEDGLEICYRTYDKKLVISQHDFVAAEKTLLEEELDEQLSSEGHQVYNDIVYTVCFSVHGIKDEKSVVYNRGNINLCGLKVTLETKQRKQQKQQKQEQETEYYKQLRIDGYINIQLDTTVNSNMLKQPVAKQIRTYAQKLICLLQKSDAI